MQNHPFVDGNKRAGAASALVFLELNGVRLSPRTGELYEITMVVATGGSGKGEAAAFFRERCGSRGEGDAGGR